MKFTRKSLGGEFHLPGANEGVVERRLFAHERRRRGTGGQGVNARGEESEGERLREGGFWKI